MKSFFPLLTFAIVSSTTLSCSKHKGDIEDDGLPAASIRWASPAAGTAYHMGDSVTITATAISTATIHGYDVVIRKQNDTAACFFTHVHDHHDTLNINQKWQGNLSGNLEAEIVLYLDHDGHTKTKTVGFKIE